MIFNQELIEIFIIWSVFHVYNVLFFSLNIHTKSYEAIPYSFMLKKIKIPINVLEHKQNNNKNHKK